MKTVFRRVLLVMMIMLLAVSAVVPAAMAADSKVVSNASGLTLRVGMKDKLIVTYSGVKQKSSNFRWKTSNSSVVSVDKSGNIRGKKTGSSVISATDKRDGNTLSITVTVKRNKVDNIKPKPAISAAPYKGVIVRLKSVEFVTSKKVVAEYYLCCNFPSNWKLTRIKSFQDAINLFDRNTKEFKKTVVGDAYQLFADKVSGLYPRYGSFVQVIKVTYSGNRVHTNAKLSDYLIDNSNNTQIKYDYSFR